MVTCSLKGGNFRNYSVSRITLGVINGERLERVEAPSVAVEKSRAGTPRGVEW